MNIFNVFSKDSKLHKGKNLFLVFTTVSQSWEMCLEISDHLISIVECIHEGRVGAWVLPRRMNKTIAWVKSSLEVGGEYKIGSAKIMRHSQMVNGSLWVQHSWNHDKDSHDCVNVIYTLTLNQIKRSKWIYLKLVIFYNVPFILSNCKINVTKEQGKYFHQTINEVHSLSSVHNLSLNVIESIMMHM